MRNEVAVATVCNQCCFCSKILADIPGAIDHMKRGFKKGYCVCDMMKHEYALAIPDPMKCNVCCEVVRLK